MCTCESIRPGIAVMPSASITTSASSVATEDAVPTEAICPPSTMIVSPWVNGSRQSPEMIWPRLTIATFMAPAVPSSIRFATELVFEPVGFHQAVHQAGGAIPVEGAVAMASGDKARPRIEHLILGMARAELGADRVPRGLQELHLLFWAHLCGALSHVDDALEFGVLKVVNRGGQHNKSAAGQLAQRIDDARIKILRQHLRGIHEMFVRHVPLA